MSREVLIIVVALALWVVWSIYAIVKGIMKGEGKFRLKQIANGSMWLAALMWAMCFLISAISILPNVIDWANSMADKMLTQLGQIVFLFMPFVYVITLLFIFSWVLIQSWKPWWKYTEKEEGKIREERQRTRGKLQKWIPF